MTCVDLGISLPTYGPLYVEFLLLLITLEWSSLLLQFIDWDIFTTLEAVKIDTSNPATEKIDE